MSEAYGQAEAEADGAYADVLAAGCSEDEAQKAYHSPWLASQIIQRRKRDNVTDEFGDGSLLDEIEKVPSISWRDAKVGQKLVVRIEELPTKKIQRKIFGTNELDFWPLKDGQTERNPKLNTFTKVTILEGSDSWTKWAKKKQTENPQPVGVVRNWWTNIPSQPLAELGRLNGQLKSEIGRGLRVGDIVEVLLSDEKEIEGKPDYDTQKIFTMKYLRTETPATPSIFDEPDA